MINKEYILANPGKIYDNLLNRLSPSLVDQFHEIDNVIGVYHLADSTAILTATIRDGSPSFVSKAKSSTVPKQITSSEARDITLEAVAEAERQSTHYVHNLELKLASETPQVLDHDYSSFLQLVAEANPNYDLGQIVEKPKE